MQISFINKKQIKIIGALLLTVGLLSLPFWADKSWISVITEVMILSVAVTALNMLIGYCGLVAFGHAAFYAVGAYTVALVITKTAIPFWVSFLAAPFVSAIIALIVGWFCLRLVEVYFSLLTVAFAQVIFYILFEWYSFTGGDQGIGGLPVPDLLMPVSNYYFFTLVITLICLGIMWLISRSPFGMSCQAIRENKERVSFVGIDVRKYELIAFVLSGFFIGISGALYASFARAAFPTYGNFLKSGEFILTCLLGGIFNFAGPLVGAFIFVVLDHIITGFTEYWAFVLGIILIVICLFLRGGVVGYITDKYQRIFVS
jgi:branched-chain amino acid transport system permease protein